MFLDEILRVLGLSRIIVLRLERSYMVYLWIVLWGKPSRFGGQVCRFSRGYDQGTMVG